MDDTEDNYDEHIIRARRIYNNPESSESVRYLAAALLSALYKTDPYIQFAGCYPYQEHDVLGWDAESALVILKKASFETANAQAINDAVINITIARESADKAMSAALAAHNDVIKAKELTQALVHLKHTLDDNSHYFTPEEKEDFFLRIMDQP